MTMAVKPLLTSGNPSRDKGHQRCRRRVAIVLVVCALSVVSARSAVAQTWHYYELYSTADVGLRYVGSAPSLNNLGQVSFIGAPGNRYYCLMGDGGPLTRMDDDAHQAGSPDNANPPIITDSGLVCYVGANIQDPIFRSDGTPVSMFESPYGSCRGTSMNSAGTVVTQAYDMQYYDPIWGYPMGIFATSDGVNVTTVAKQRVTECPYSGGNPFTYFDQRPSINESGTIAFRGWTGDASASMACTATPGASSNA